MKTLEQTELQQNDRMALQAAVKKLKENYSIEKMLLFGSKVRGDSDAHSDIDLLIITSQSLSWREEKAIVEELFEIGMEYGVMFSPIFASFHEWENGVFSQFPIYDEIMANGAELA